MSIENEGYNHEQYKEPVYLEELPYISNFGVVDEYGISKILKENENLRLLTITELYILNKTHKFKDKSYWSSESVSTTIDHLREFRPAGIVFKPAIYHPRENPNTQKHLILINKNHVIDGVDTVDISDLLI